LKKIKIILDKWEVLKRYKYIEEMTKAKSNKIAFYITDKGIEVGLKIQEHNDNERRHKTTTKISDRAFGISSFALIIAFISAGMNGYRLELLQNKNIEFIDTQERIIKELKRPGDKKSVEIILKYEDDKIIVKDDL
jgi:hypothetical protein